MCKKVFAALPLAAVIGGQTLVLHGGAYSTLCSSPALRVVWHTAEICHSPRHMGCGTTCMHLVVPCCSTSCLYLAQAGTNVVLLPCPGLFRKPSQGTRRRKKRRKTLPGSLHGAGTLTYSFTRYRHEVYTSQSQFAHGALVLHLLKATAQVSTPM